MLAPAADLAGLVERGIVLQQPRAHSSSRFPAMSRAMLTLGADAGGAPDVQLHAPGTRPRAFEHAQPFEALGLVLPATTAACLLGPSTGVVVDAVLPWAAVAGEAESRRVVDALSVVARGPVAERPLRSLQVLQASLRRVLARGPERVHDARAEALQQLGHAVAQHGARAAGRLGLGERQLERRCRAWLGLGPKQLQRMTRFSAVLAEAVRRQRVPDADAALAWGYCDQSHLARDARQLAGAPLRELLAGAHADGAWWPLATQPRGLQSSGSVG